MMCSKSLFVFVVSALGLAAFAADAAGAAWSFRTTGDRLLAVGNHAYSNDTLTAEVDLAPDKASELVFSNGGTMIVLKAADGKITGPGGKVVSQLPAGKSAKLRVVVTLRSAECGVDGQRAVKLAAPIVSEELKKPENAKLNPALRGVMRNGGVAVVSGEAPSAMCANIISAQTPKFPKEVEWAIAYDAASGNPGMEWRSSYPAGKAAVSDGVLKLDNRTAGSQRWSAFHYITPAQLSSLGRYIVVEFEVAFGGGLAADTPNFFTFGAALFPEGKHHEIIIYLAPDALNSSLGKAAVTFPVGQFRKIAAVLDTETDIAGIWVDGALVLGGKTSIDRMRKQSALFWGDGATPTGGLAEVKSVRVGGTD